MTGAATPARSAGPALRDRVGIAQIMFEADYPHGDSTCPNSSDTTVFLSQNDRWFNPTGRSTPPQGRFRTH